MFFYSRGKLSGILLTLFCTLIFSGAYSQTGNETAAIYFEPVHVWRPPFGLDRVGRSVDVIVTVPDNGARLSAYQLTSLSNGQKLATETLSFTGSKSDSARLTIRESADEVVVQGKTSSGQWKELARSKPSLPMFECDASTRPATFKHPIDMGVILAPANWLVINGGQVSFADLALISRKQGSEKYDVRAWFASQPDKAVTKSVSLTGGKKSSLSIQLPPASNSLEKDSLHLTVKDASGNQVWEKGIHVMLVQKMQKFPGFGVAETKLRYDVPITNIVDGKNQPFSYDSAWSPDKKDYVVFLPNGSRWVFWRGASYIPVWVSKYNTGLSYEWAERISPLDGFKDCPEPLMDKQLRYGKVEVVESTNARVHVRWNYQSCDFNYKVNGDFAQEDYYFYPDGLGTRVLTLTCLPVAEYEVAEFILLAPPAALPFDVMPDNPMQIISYQTGKSASLSLPEKDTTWKTLADPVIYRMKIHKKEPLTAFSFSPLLHKKPWAFAPFKDQGLIVTPAYWGGHWPLSQGFNTGRSINESIWTGPSHNSLITFANKRPEPIRSKTFETRDALGVVKQMREETWVWLIGMTDESDQSLLETSRSFAQPATLTVKGGRQEPDGYASERRAYKLIADSKKLSVTIQPQSWCVNPAFEIKFAPKEIKEIKLGGVVLPADKYAWDGNTLWVNAKFKDRRELDIQFKN